MDPKTKRLLIKAFADFLKVIFAIAGEEGIRIIRKVFEEWQEAKPPKLKITRSRSRRKKS